ncbi:MAG: hypothetical protein QOJ67_2703 [Acidimicrobiaceae bacterium]
MTDFPPPGGTLPPAPVPAPPLAAPAPPGTAPYAPGGYQTGWNATAPAPQPHQPLKGLATALTVLLLLAALAAIVAGMAFLSRATLVDDLLADRGSLLDLSNKDDAVRTTSSLFFLAFIITGVLWIVWQFRHAKNAERLRGSLGLGPGWAVGGWFLPFGNFIVPALQLRQAAQASDPELPAGAPWRNGKAPALVIVWALVFDASAICFVTAGSLRPSTDDLFTGRKQFSDFASADRAAAAGMFGYALAAALAVFLVRALTDRQERAAATITPAALAAPVFVAQPQAQWGAPPAPPAPPAPQWGAPPPPPGQWGPPPAP